MRSKSPVFKLALLMVLILLVMSIASGTPALADGGGDQPFPPTKSPSPGGDDGESPFVTTLLTILQFIL